MESKPIRAFASPKPIRAFARGLAVLEALNNQGSATALALSRETGIPRATVYRLLRTLQDGGYVGRAMGDDRFHPRLNIRRLSGASKTNSGSPRLPARRCMR